MANDSPTIGFLVPVGTEPDYDAALDDAIHHTIAGVTGLDLDLVRPSDEPESATSPHKDTPSWVSYRVSVTRPDSFESQVPADTPEGGTVTVGRNERLTVVVSFFGPQASKMEARMRDGLALSLNRYMLQAASMALIEMTEPTVIPSLLKNSFRRRVDSTLILNRYARRTYQVRSFVDFAVSSLDNERYITPLVVPTPP